MGAGTKSIKIRGPGDVEDGATFYISSSDCGREGHFVFSLTTKGFKGWDIEIKPNMISLVLSSGDLEKLKRFFVEYPGGDVIDIKGMGRSAISSSSIDDTPSSSTSS